MKLFQAGLAILLTKQAHAGFALIEAALNTAINHNKTLTSGPGLRSFNQLVDNVIVSIRDGWGCWCYFDDESYQGRGNPINDVDSYCKTLQQGYECFEMDDGNTCMDPWDVPYVAVDLTSIVNDDYESACNAQNGRNNCAKRACIIESRFSDMILKYYAAGGGFDALLMHDNNAWDVHSSCPIKVIGNAGAIHKECCGDYPERFPFKQTGDRGCCQGVTFDTGLFQCCQDGSIEVVCS
jgi:hypothetical protein